MTTVVIAMTANLVMILSAVLATAKDVFGKTVHSAVGQVCHD